jgi:hypothetical protein
MPADNADLDFVQGMLRAYLEEKDLLMESVRCGDITLKQARQIIHSDAEDRINQLCRYFRINEPDEDTKRRRAYEFESMLPFMRQ